MNNNTNTNITKEQAMQMISVGLQALNDTDRNQFLQGIAEQVNTLNNNNQPQEQPQQEQPVQGGNDMDNEKAQAIEVLSNEISALQASIQQKSALGLNTVGDMVILQQKTKQLYNLAGMGINNKVKQVVSSTVGFTQEKVLQGTIAPTANYGVGLLDSILGFIEDSLAYGVPNTMDAIKDTVTPTVNGIYESAKVGANKTGELVGKTRQYTVPATQNEVEKLLDLTNGYLNNLR